MPCWFSAFLGRSIGDFPLSYFACGANKHQGGILDKKAVKSMSLWFPTPSGPALETTPGTQPGGLSDSRGGILFLAPPEMFPQALSAFSYGPIYNEKWKLRPKLGYTAIEEKRWYIWMIDWPNLIITQRLAFIFKFADSYSNWMDWGQFSGWLKWGHLLEIRKHWGVIFLFVIHWQLKWFLAERKVATDKFFWLILTGSLWFVEVAYTSLGCEAKGKRTHPKPLAEENWGDEDMPLYIPTVTFFSFF